MIRSLRRRRALTLVELLVVMMILVILAGSVMLYVVNKVDQARIARATADIATFETALETYAVSLGEYPTTEQGLDALWSAPSGVEEERWRRGGPFVKKKNYTDPWGNGYIYHSPGAEDRDYEIICYGADGKEGGEDKDADISNWDVAVP